jgi:hypothetical protein
MTTSSGFDWSSWTTSATEPPNFETLADVIEAIRHVLDKITDAWSPLLIRQESRADLRRAFEDADSHLNVFEKLKIEVNNPHNAGELRDVGLAPSAQLTTKLRQGSRRIKAFWKLGGRKMLGKVLEYFNRMLASLGRVLIGGELIKELKETCEAELQETED